MTIVALGSCLGFPYQAWFPSWPYSQLDSSWLPPTCEHHLLHLYGYFSTLIIVVVHRCCDWVGPFDCFLTLAACIMFSGIVEARGQRRGFQDRASSNHRSPISSVCGVFRSRPFTFNLWEVAKGKSKSLYCLRSHLDYPDQPFWRRFLMSGTVVSLSLWFLWGTLSAQVVELP